MATSAAILIQRNTPPAGSLVQTCDILVNDTIPNYWLWTAHDIPVADTDVQVQAILSANVAQYLAEIAANNETPLTAEQVATYQLIIDAFKADSWIPILQAWKDFITTSTVLDNTSPTLGAGDYPTGIIDALTGIQNGAKPSNYTPLANANKFAFLGAAVFELAKMQREQMNALILAMKYIKHSAQ